MEISHLSLTIGYVMCPRVVHLGRRSPIHTLESPKGHFLDFLAFSSFQVGQSHKP